MMPTLVGIILVVLLIGLVLRRFKQPQVVAYLLAGLALGPYGLDVLADQAAIARLGEIGVVLLLFFLGMEVSLPQLAAGWRVALIGTVLQIGVSVASAFALGDALGWPPGRIVLMGFVISLSSTAVVVSVLRARGELATEAGRDAIGILLVQDVLLVPMLIIIGLMSGDSPDPTQAGMQIGGGVLIIAVVVWIGRKGTITLPFSRFLKGDHELQVFAALLACFGVALVTALLGLSTALGAFVGGIVIAAAKETRWVHEALEPLRVLLVALFFLSIGLLIDIPFVIENWEIVLALVMAALATNTILNALILRVLGLRWGHSFYVASLLAQIGEFSFVLAAVGLQVGLIADFSYQLTVVVIAGTLILSPAWVSLAHRGVGRMQPKATSSGDEALEDGLSR